MLRLPIENTSDKKGEIMAEWKNYTLEEVCERIYSGGTPSTKHEEYWNGDIKWLSSGETSQRFVYDTERKITQEGVENSSTKLATKGCTVVATAGQGYTRGQASFLMTDTYMNQSVIACKANENVILPLYLYYNLDSRYEEFRLLSDGTSTRGGLSGWILKRMEIKLPPKSSQKKIIDILYSIDRKIEENKAINNNLEQQAKAIFKSWFIDFEPFSNRKPSDWSVSTLGNVSIMGAGGDKPQNVSPIKTDLYEYPIYSNGLSNEGLYGFTDKPKISEESVTVSARGTIGFVCLRHIPYVPIVRLVTLIPKTEIVSAKYLYLWLKQLHITGTGTTQQQLTVPDFQKTEILVPSQKVVTLFTATVEPIFEKIWANQNENEKLSSLRDTLLPKLMSGEIDVSDIDL